MIISSLDTFALDGVSTLTPTRVRGLFLIWRSEIQHAKQLAEIREFHGSTNVTDSFPEGTPGVGTGATRLEALRNRTNGTDDLPDAQFW